MHRERVLAVCLLAVGIAYAQRVIGPQPPVMDPGGGGKAPSDAVVLFNGRDNTGWTRLDGTPSHCTVADGVMTCRTGALDTASTEKFRNAQIHVEFNVPNEPDQKGYARANGGIILQNLYEIQILDNYKSEVAPDSQCAALYRQSPPLVNACRPPGEWQSYDIVFHAPTCASDGSVQTPGSLTLLHNGVLVQDQVPVRGRRCVAEGPLVLQDHSRVVGRTIEIEEGPINGPAPETDMRYRNIWMRRLSQ
ncbi:MAG TPA: DUF1080 domain-containing protein [Bryobacteraceae bacterium]|nr:DUF1080 domain-containing protein [Bryobacteraceae bacterium]